MLAALFAAAAARSVAAPGRPEVIIFEQSADSAGTAAGQQAQDGQEAALQQHAAEEELRKAEESMKGQIDAVTKAEQDEVMRRLYGKYWKMKPDHPKGLSGVEQLKERLETADKRYEEKVVSF